MTTEEPAMPKEAMSYASVLSPAIAAALAGGAGYLTSSRGRGRPGETEEERRARILRNTLGMGAAGGVAGLTLPMAMSILGDAAPERDLLARITSAVPAPLRGVVGGLAGGAGLWRNSDPAQAERRGIADVEKRTRKAFPHGAHRTEEAGKFRSSELGKLPSTDALRTRRLMRTGYGAGGGAALGLALPWVGEAAGHPLLAPLLGAGVGGAAGAKFGPQIPGNRLRGPHGRAWGAGLGALLGSLLGSGAERTDEALFKGNPINPFQ